MATKLLTPLGGGITLDAANTATDKTVTIPATTGTIALQETKITSGTAVASTSGTSIDFTSIPSWVKRITVMFNGVSTNGTSPILFQLGAGSVTTSGYVGGASRLGSASMNSITVSAGFGIYLGAAADTYGGSIVLTNINSNSWSANGVFGSGGGTMTFVCGGGIGLSGTLDRVRITTVNGTDTFDAGSINILYE